MNVGDFYQWSLQSGSETDTSLHTVDGSYSYGRGRRRTLATTALLLSFTARKLS